MKKLILGIILAVVIAVPVKTLNHKSTNSEITPAGNGNCLSPDGLAQVCPQDMVYTNGVKQVPQDNIPSDKSTPVDPIPVAAVDDATPGAPDSTPAIAPPAPTSPTPVFQSSSKNVQAAP